MDLSPADVETDLIDLSEVSLATLNQCDHATLADSVEHLLATVRRLARPRSEEEAAE